MFSPITFASDREAMWRAGPPMPHPISYKIIIIVVILRSTEVGEYLLVILHLSSLLLRCLLGDSKTISCCSGVGPLFGRATDPTLLVLGFGIRFVIGLGLGLRLGLVSLSLSLSLFIHKKQTSKNKT